MSQLPCLSDPDFLALKQSCKDFLLKWYKQYYMTTFKYVETKAEYEAYQKFEQNVMSGQDLSLKNAQDEYMRQKTLGILKPSVQHANWNVHFQTNQNRTSLATASNTGASHSNTSVATMNRPLQHQHYQSQQHHHLTGANTGYQIYGANSSLGVNNMNFYQGQIVQSQQQIQNTSPNTHSIPYSWAGAVSTPGGGISIPPPSNINRGIEAPRGVIAHGSSHLMNHKLSNTSLSTADEVAKKAAELLDQRSTNYMMASSPIQTQKKRSRRAAGFDSSPPRGSDIQMSPSQPPPPPPPPPTDPPNSPHLFKKRRQWSSSGHMNLASPLSSSSPSPNITTTTTNNREDFMNDEDEDVIKFNTNNKHIISINGSQNSYDNLDGMNLDRNIAAKLKTWEKETKLRIKLESGYKKFMGDYAKELGVAVQERKSAVWSRVEDARNSSHNIRPEELIASIEPLTHNIIRERVGNNRLLLKKKGKSPHVGNYWSSDTLHGSESGATGVGSGGLGDKTALINRAHRFRSSSTGTIDNNELRVGGAQTELRRLNWMEKLELLNSTERVIGRSTILEKEYLRLTSVPDPATVRPYSTLKDSFPYVLKRYEARGNDWRYLESQLKSIRQDLTVQGIRNTFAIRVYEENCRKALENEDLGQYNQAQTQLFYLYEDAAREKSAFDVTSSNTLAIQGDYNEGLLNFDEFICLRLLYLTLNDMAHDIIKVLSGLDLYTTKEATLTVNVESEGSRGSDTANEKTKEKDSSSSIDTVEVAKGIGYSFAMSVLNVFRCNNYIRLFNLSEKSPYEHAKMLIKLYMPRLRMHYLIQLTRGSHLLEYTFLTKTLRFEEEDECLVFLSDNLGDKNLRAHSSYDEDHKTRLTGLFCKKGINQIIANNPLIAGRKMKAMG